MRSYPENKKLKGAGEKKKREIMGLVQLAECFVVSINLSNANLNEHKISVVVHCVFFKELLAVSFLHQPWTKQLP